MHVTPARSLLRFVFRADMLESGRLLAFDRFFAAHVHSLKRICAHAHPSSLTAYVPENSWAAGVAQRYEGRLAQLVRAPALQAGGRRFESCTAHQVPRMFLSGRNGIGNYLSDILFHSWIKIKDTLTRTCRRLRCCINRIPSAAGADLLRLYCELDWRPPP